MKLSSSRLLDRAEFALAVAAKLADSGEPGRSLGRSYYAMFYAGEAAVREGGGRTDGAFHRWLLQASDERASAEGAASPPTHRDALCSMDLATAFVADVRRRLSA